MNIFFRYVILFLSITNCLFAQNKYPQGDFRGPLDIAPSFSGSFGELRNNHFHSGLDYRTNQREGYPVYAVADGFVSRLRVQNGGFGNAVYISHPNGYTSVYAHLQKFNPKIAQTVKDYQYRKQSFDVDFPLLSIEIPVKKGEIIAWSGNSGSSGGPHLHFEIRDSKTEETINPALLGIEVPDKIKPVIADLYLYRLNELPFSENTPKQYFQVIGEAGKYKLNRDPIINVDGEIGFGIVTYDQNSAGGFKNGVYSIELLLDGTPIYLSELERFYFQNSRAINSHIDYPTFLTNGRKIQKSFVEPGNPLGIYKKLVNSGRLKLNDDAIHNLEYVVKDVVGNTATLAFRVKRNSLSVIPVKFPEGQQNFFYNNVNEFRTQDLRVSIPAKTLYSDINFKYSTSQKPAKAFSAVHNIHTRLIPLHGPYDLWIKADSSLNPSLYTKALIVDNRGVSQGGAYENGWVKAQPKIFGSFYITVDTVAPTITPVNIYDGKSFKDIDEVIFKISDNLSGIKTFTGTIDGQWILMEYDPKTRKLWHTFDERTLPGKHLMQLTVTDMKDNTEVYTATIYR